MHFDYNRHKNLVLNLVDHETSKSIIKKGFSWLNTPIQSHQREPPNEKLQSYLSKILKIKTFLVQYCVQYHCSETWQFFISSKGLFSVFYNISWSLFFIFCHNAKMLYHFRYIVIYMHKCPTSAYFLQ